MFNNAQQPSTVSFQKKSGLNLLFYLCQDLAQVLLVLVWITNSQTAPSVPHQIGPRYFVTSTRIYTAYNLLVTGNSIYMARIEIGIKTKTFSTMIFVKFYIAPSNQNQTQLSIVKFSILISLFQSFYLYSTSFTKCTETNNSL